MAYPDTVKALIEFLNAKTDTNWTGSTPNPRPGEFGLVFRTGGPAPSRIQDQPTIALEAWAGSKRRSAEMLNAARDAIAHEFTGKVGSLFVHFREEVGGPGDLPDPTSNQARHTCLWSFRVRATS